MKIISHRGNINGPDKKLENNPDHILSIIGKYEVEIDVWYKNKQWFLGHDNPEYKVEHNFFNQNMWIHCKNIEAVEKMFDISHFFDLNWFWHEEDKITITSKGYLWCYPGVYINNGITVEKYKKQTLPNGILGICTDYMEFYL